jgi:hypothetical protein
MSKIEGLFKRFEALIVAVLVSGLLVFGQQVPIGNFPGHSAASTTPVVVADGGPGRPPCSC